MDGGDAPIAAGPGAGHDRSTEAERFARALDAIADGAPLAVAIDALAGDEEMADLLRLAGAAALWMPASIAAPARARQLAALRARCEHESGAAAARSNDNAPHRAPPRGPSARMRPGATWPRRPAAAWPRLALRLTAAVVAVALGLGSAVVASANDVPGDALYPVKRAAESARMALTFDPGRRAAYHLELASLRISELRSLVNRGRSPSAGVVEALIDQLLAAEEDATTARDGALQIRARAARSEAAERCTRSPTGCRPLGRTPSAAAGSLGPPAAPASGHPAGQPAPAGATPRTVRSGAATPSPTARPTDALGTRSGVSGPTAGPATAEPPATAGAALATAVPVDRPATSEPGAAPTADESGRAGGAPTEAPQPPAVEPPAEATAAPTSANPLRDARATDLARQPPKPTRTPKPKRGR
ncbi:MAG: DUF5667 domain-containing protein [Candidatus Binatia bacterium]